MDTWRTFHKWTSNTTEPKVGLRISCEKTKAMSVPHPTVDQKYIKFMKNFQYLSSYISRADHSDVDIYTRTQKASAMFQRIHSICKTSRSEARWTTAIYCWYVWVLKHPCFYCMVVWLYVSRLFVDLFWLLVNYMRTCWVACLDRLMPLWQPVNVSVHIYTVFQKSSPLKLCGIFSLQLSLFAWIFSNLLAIYIRIHLPIFVHLS